VRHGVALLRYGYRIDASAPGVLADIVRESRRESSERWIVVG
jgi:hypothetical protein